MKHASSYYIGLNYGVLTIDWDQQSLQIDVRRQDGSTVLSTGQRTLKTPHPSWTEQDLMSIRKTMDGHVMPWLKMACTVVLVAVSIFFVTTQRPF